MVEKLRHTIDINPTPRIVSKNLEGIKKKSQPLPEEWSVWTQQLVTQL